jgi:P27 family predicted phage terminase small subunit
MGSRGPIPDPRSERSKAGRNTANRRLRKQTASPVRIPAALSKIPVAASFWRRQAPHLIESGRLTADRVDAFAMLCRLAADIEVLEQELAVGGFVIMTERGPAANPAAALARAARTDWVKLARDFGLTPAAAARLPNMGDDDGEAEGDDEAKLRAFTGTG